MTSGFKTSLACALLLLLYAVVAWLAIDSKGATYDEPYHALAGWVQLHHHDYRMDSEDPPLWMYWASLPNRSNALSADFDSPDWLGIPIDVGLQWRWGVTTLYRTPGNDPATLIHRCRAMLLLIAVFLGAMIARWAWKIGRGVAAVAATFLYCLDPNFIAHGALMKNDVVFSLSMFLLAMEIWQAGRTLSVWSIVRLALLCILTLTVKFSGLVAITLLPILLIGRAMLPAAWLTLGRTIKSRMQRCLIAAAVIVFCGVVSFAGIWAVYGFRFIPTPNPAITLNLQELAQRARDNRFAAGGSDESTLAIDAALLANRHHLLPQAYLAGFLFTYANAQAHPAFAAGQISMIGWWWYFPYAMLVKTPAVTILFIIVAALVVLRRRPFTWTAACLGLPFAVFLASAMSSHFNIGLRHILPVYPFLFVTIGWATGRLWAGGKQTPRALLCAAAGLLAIESLSSYPNFIPFFNPIATNIGGGKLNLLSDSNLDWGQDLPLLARWQKSHPNIPLYLSYFGYEDPAYYKINYIPLPGGYRYDPKPRLPDPYEHCVIAISATNLQGVLEPPRTRELYRQIARLKLIDTLGGTIYLFDHDPSQAR